MLEKRNFYINGKWVSPSKQNDIQVINPATEKSCAIISLGGKEDIHSAVMAAKEAFKTWGFRLKKNVFHYWKHFILYIKKDGMILLRQLFKKWELQKILHQNYKQVLEQAIQNHLKGT